MIINNLLSFKKNIHSQNGEDGIISEIFREIGIKYFQSCEFGAWDGIHFSNCRNLIIDGWGCLMIEGNPERYKDCCNNYADNAKVKILNEFVDTKTHSLDNLLGFCHLNNLDFLSIDIDGLDFDILESLKVRPRVICIEVNAGHSPDNVNLLPSQIAAKNVGQPLNKFLELGESFGYSLVCYNGNAFFVQNECVEGTKLRALSASTAYTEFLQSLDIKEKEWLFLVNIGKVAPFYYYNNSYLTRKNLRISRIRSIALLLKSLFIKNTKGFVKYLTLNK